jgi:hypothetical protein
MKRASTSKNILTVLKSHANQEHCSNFLSPFAETLEISSNIIMVFYILKFVNALLARTMKLTDSAMVKEEIANIKYNSII